MKNLIRPFYAILPNQQWYKQLLSTDRVGLIKSLLEPKNEMPEEHWKLQRHTDALDTMLHAGNYSRGQRPALYVYEHETQFGSQVGVWVQTSLEAIEDRIITHEQTLSDHLERHMTYREQVGLEGTPVLLTYSRNPGIAMLIENVAKRTETAHFIVHGHGHKIWEVTDQQTIDSFVNAFEKITRIYVADGHHRLAAAAAMEKSTGQQWISSLYLSSGQLRCREFNRLILPQEDVNKEDLMNAIQQHFFIRPVSNNEPVRPVRSGSVGLFFQGQWYHLDWKADRELIQRIPDVCLLQEKIFQPFFDINDPRADTRLQSWSANDWDSMFEYIQTQQNAIVFTLCPLDPDTFIYLSDKGTLLPPKSTYMEPKVPYGMLLSTKS